MAELLENLGVHGFRLWGFDLSSMNSPSQLCGGDAGGGGGGRTEDEQSEEVASNVHTSHGISMQPRRGRSRDKQNKNFMQLHFRSFHR
jgi:hypothetical protein